MIGILDYGVGNVQAIARACELQSIPFKIIREPRQVADASHLILPGVGHFDRALDRFGASGLKLAVEEAVGPRRTPILGICVGFQMMAKCSEEGLQPGLGWFSTTVRKLPRETGTSVLRLPHMGWNHVSSPPEAGLFQGIKNPIFYFLHSFVHEGEMKDGLMSHSHYGQDFVVAIQHKNFFGVQFHPEKSHEVGMQLLANFYKMGCDVGV